MNAFNLFAKLTLDSSEYDKDVKKAENTLVGGISNAVKTASKILATLGIAKTFKDAISEGAALQQSIGGVETLFKQNAETVKNFAAEAYKTAGLSANEYMETVTGFSASLLQSLGGDTAKAAKIANRAIIDMSDNANKMGTAMESIQVAYQGFAKQNYTMLDNLKLGYGGTKEEMERLIKDASQMTDIQQKLNITVNEGDMSFANIANAISVVQEKLGIAGTTAEEAEKTFTGSLAAMKSAWKNLLGTLTTGGDIEKSFDELFASANTFFFGNFLPMIGKVFKSLPEIVSNAMRGLTSVIKDGFSGSVADFVDSGIEIVTGLAEGIAKAAPYLLSAAAGLVKQFVKALSDVNWKDVIMTTFNHIRGALTDAAYSIFGSAGGDMVRVMLREAENELWTSLNRIRDAFANVISRIKEALEPILQKISEYVKSGQMAHDVTNLLVNAMNLFATAVEVGAKVLTAVVDKITEFVSWLKSGSDSANMFKGAIVSIAATMLTYEAIMAVLALKTKALELATKAAAVAQALFNAVMNANPVVMVVSAIVGLIAALAALYMTSEKFRNAVQGFFDEVGNAVNTVVSSIGKAFESIKQFFVNLYNNAVNWVKRFFNIGQEIVTGIWNGIKNAWDKLVQQWNDLWDKLLGGVRNLLGIHSPSKVFADIGKNMALGVGQGWDKAFASVGDDINSSLDFGEQTVSTTSTNGNSARIDYVQSQTNSQPIDITLQLDGMTLARLMYDYNKREAQLRGGALA